LDFETKSTYSIVVEVTDLGGLKASATFTVRLTNVNEAPYWATALPVLSAKAAVLQTLKPALGAPYAADQDLNVTATGDGLTFSIVSGNLPGYFGINPVSGEISVLVTTLQSGSNFNLGIRIQDRGINGAQLSNTTSVTVTVVDNILSPFFASPTYTISVSENSAYLASVGTAIAASHPTLPQTLTYLIEASGDYNGFSNAVLPFPFSVTTVPNSGNNNLGSAQIRVRSDGVSSSVLFNLDFETRNSYQLTLTALDSRSPPQSATATVFINVLDVNEAPYFNAATRVPGSGYYVVSIPEHTPTSNAVGFTASIVAPPLSINAGNSSSGGILGFDQDSVDVGRLSYSLSTSAIFNIGLSTGRIVGGSGATVLNFEAVKSHTLSVIVTDSIGQSDTASLQVNVIDVNEVSDFGAPGAGVFDSAGVQIVSGAFSIPENTVRGFLIGSVRATDPDTPGTAFATLRYSFVSNSESDPFIIDEVSGNITLNVPSFIDWEDKPVWSPTVRVIDTSSTPLNTTRIVQIHITDVNDVSITSVRVEAASVTSDLGMNMVSTSPYFATLGGNSILARTVGGARVIFSGTNLGLTSRRLAAEGRSAASTTTMNITYGTASFWQYTATNCAVSTSNTEITCTLPPGFGQNHVWRFSLANSVSGAVLGFTGSSGILTGYYPPSVSSIVVSGASSTNASENTMPTAGGTVLSLTGRDFGPIGSPISLRYMSSTSTLNKIIAATGCSLTSAHTGATCSSAEGVGGGLRFTLQIGVDASGAGAEFSATLVRYATPAISSILPTTPIPTRGVDTTIFLTGRNFGPVGSDIIVRYSTAAAWADSSQGYVYTASNCVVVASKAHTQVSCTAAPGIGAALSFVITVGGQIADSPSTSTVSYSSPSVTGISGPGSLGGPTQGNQLIYLAGTNFGPATLTEPSGALLAGAIAPIARYGHISGANMTMSSLNFLALTCRVTVSHTQITCSTTEGTGRDLYWAVSIATRVSPIFLGKTSSYSPPVVSRYAGAGSRLARTVGGELVVITGNNFGPVGSPIDFVTYGLSGNDFNAASCVITVAHTELECSTTSGAGSDVTWLVSIDGQVSTVSSTDYAPPSVDDVTGPGAIDASTDGGDIVHIHGNNFATNEFLGSVTYGPSGTEYKASGCFVSTNHTQITCSTVAGTGRRLRWVVQVRGQASLVSEKTTSYAPPTLYSVSPAGGPTAGSTVLTLSGKDLGLISPNSSLVIRINSQATVSNARPSDAVLAAYWDSVLAGGPQSGSNAAGSAVALWVASLSRPIAVNPLNTVGKNWTLQFQLPMGYGADLDLFVVVDGVPSNRLAVSYNPPVIFNLAPDRLNVSAGQLRLFVEGNNFCNFANGCGELYVNNELVLAPFLDIESWTDRGMMAIVEDPNKDGDKTRSSYVMVRVAGRWSNNVSFSAPVPSFDALSGQGSWGASKTLVDSAEITFALELNGVPDSSLNDPLVTCALRSSIDALSEERLFPSQWTLLAASSPLADLLTPTLCPRSCQTSPVLSLEALAFSLMQYRPSLLLLESTPAPSQQRLIPPQLQQLSQRRSSLQEARSRLPVAQGSTSTMCSLLQTRRQQTSRSLSEAASA